jgi:hypothetical protein
MVYFNTSAVFASLLSHPTLNKDECFLFRRQKDPFAKPSKPSDVGDINTCCCCRKTFNALVKKVGVDLILPTIMAMDKTHIDLTGHLQMEQAHHYVAWSIKARHALQTIGNANPWLYQPQFPRTRSTTKNRQDHNQQASFPKGFSSGSNLMGGCLLVKLYALHTTPHASALSSRWEQSNHQNGRRKRRSPLCLSVATTCVDVTSIGHCLWCNKRILCAVKKKS